MEEVLGSKGFLFRIAEVQVFKSQVLYMNGYGGKRGSCDYIGVNHGHTGGKHHVTTFYIGLLTNQAIFSVVWGHISYQNSCPFKIYDKFHVCMSVTNEQTKEQMERETNGQRN